LPCTTPLFGLGPVDPVHGFPQYYQDSTGLALQPCLDLVCDPALPVPDPTLPVSFPNNFPDEFFYSRVINTMTVGTMKVIYVAALEGSFANGVVVAGDQVVFARLRFRILGATPNATYTFTHPYGVDVVQADGVGFVNSTTDVGIVPIGLLPTAFQLAIGGRVGPFMTAVTPPPPAGLVGNPAADQTVTGSACNQNFVRVEGPGFPVGGQQNNLFSTIIGKIAHICGNGVLDLGEQCDDGNLVAGDCCSPLCTAEPLGQACGAPDVCVNNACDGAGTCAFVNFTVAPCTDRNVCTVADTCTLGRVSVRQTPATTPTCARPTSARRPPWAAGTSTTRWRATTATQPPPATAARAAGAWAPSAGRRSPSSAARIRACPASRRRATPARMEPGRG